MSDSNRSSTLVKIAGLLVPNGGGKWSVNPDYTPKARTGGGGRTATQRTVTAEMAAEFATIEAEFGV